MADPSLHWYIITIQQTVTATGYTIVVTTNNPAHLTLRWTSTVPQKHFLPVMRRGASVGTIIDQCFVAYTDVPQDEAGDTLTHTFQITPWPTCEWRWFYFWGTVGRQDSPSLSPIYEKHRTAPSYGPPQQLTVYPEQYPGTLTGIGYVWRHAVEPFLTLRNGPGNNSTIPTDQVSVGFRTLHARPNFTILVRTILTFNTTSIPTGSILHDAKITFRCSGIGTIHWPLAAVVPVTSYPLSNTVFVPSDYGRTNTTPLSTPILLTAMSYLSPHTWPLNPDGLAAIIPGAITRLAIRESTYDIPNTDPGWISRGAALCNILSTYHTWPPSYYPTLTVNYSPPL
jgi:hypothetical protein